MAILETSIEELGLGGVPFPPGFAPRYFTVDSDGCSYVHEAEPVFDGCEWNSDSWYELGVDDTPDREHTAALVKGLTPADAIVRITNRP